MLPLDAMDEIELLDKKMRKGLDNPVAWLLRKNPDLDEDRAKQQIQDNLEFWAWLVRQSRELNAKQDDDEGPDRGQTPQENGAMAQDSTADAQGARMTRDQNDTDAGNEAA